MARLTLKPTLSPQNPTSCFCSDALGVPLRTAEILGSEWRPAVGFLRFFVEDASVLSRGTWGWRWKRKRSCRERNSLAAKFLFPGSIARLPSPFLRGSGRADADQRERRSCLTCRRHWCFEWHHIRRTEPLNYCTPRLSPSPRGHPPKSIRMMKKTWLARNRCAAGLLFLQMKLGAGDTISGMTRKAVPSEMSFYPSERSAPNSFHLLHLL